MSWIDIADLLVERHEGVLAGPQELEHATLTDQALRLAAWLQSVNIEKLAVYELDAGRLAVIMLGAWRAGIELVLPGDDRPQTRQRLIGDGCRWLDELGSETDWLACRPLPAARLPLGVPLLTLSTSGSTGEPKLIRKTLAQLHNELLVLEQLWGSQLQEAVFFGSVITQHIYGLLFRLLWPLCAGRHFIRHHLPFAEEIQQQSMACLAEGRPFVWVCSPALLKRMGDNLDWPQLAAVSRIFSSGGPLPADAGQRLQEQLGQAVTEVYGSSETGGIAWRQGGQAWTPLPGAQISRSAEGALQVSSSWQAEAAEQTSDAIELLDDGRFVLKGRLDRIVKLEEKRVSLPFLEDSLQQHDWVGECRLLLQQNGRASLGALVVLSTGGLHALRNGGRSQLVQALRQHLSDYCETLVLPRRWRFVEQLPVNAQGKLQQQEMERLLQEERPRQPQLLQQQGADWHWQLQLRIPHDLAFFSGHFPASPVLPGVVQVDWALLLGRRLMQLPQRFAGMEVLKFQQLIRPGDLIDLDLRFDPERSKLYFSFTADGQPCSSGRTLLVEGDD